MSCHCGSSSHSRTPDYVVNTETKIYSPRSIDPLILPAGAFVRPLDPYWVPKHIKEHPDNRWFDPANHTYCYTAYGIFLIANTNIRKV